MARDMDAPDSAGKDMDISDTRPECAEAGCTRDARPGRRTCPRHADE